LVPPFSPSKVVTVPTVLRSRYAFSRDELKDLPAN